jgi:hypothetical protein
VESGNEGDRKSGVHERGYKVLDFPIRRRRNLDHWCIRIAGHRDGSAVYVRNGGRHGHWTILISLPTVSLAYNLDAQGTTNDMDTQQELPPMRRELLGTGWQKIKARESKIAHCG